LVYTRFASLGKGQWAVTGKSGSIAEVSVRGGRRAISPTKPFATITHRRGICSAAITAGHALNCEELACLLDFMAEREQRAA